jgi:hypothetical protein
MTAAKTRRAAAPAKGKPSRGAPASRAPAKAAPARGSAATKPGTKAVGKAPGKAAPRAAPQPARPAKPAAAAPAKAPAKARPATAAPAKAPAKAVAPTVAKPVPAKTALRQPGKSVTVKSASPGRKGRDSGSEANLHKRVDSERIAEHIAAFEKSGGRVEKLGVTRVLQKVTEAPATAPAAATKSGGRRR